MEPVQIDRDPKISPGCTAQLSLMNHHTAPTFPSISYTNVSNVTRLIKCPVLVHNDRTFSGPISINSACATSKFVDETAYHQFEPVYPDVFVGTFRGSFLQVDYQLECAERPMPQI